MTPIQMDFDLTRPMLAMARYSQIKYLRRLVQTNCGKISVIMIFGKKVVKVDNAKALEAILS